MHPLKDYLNSTSASISGFAALVGVSNQTLHRILSGAQSPKPPLARRIVEATGGAVLLQNLYPPGAGGARIVDLATARPAAADNPCGDRFASCKTLDQLVLARAMKFTLAALTHRSGPDGGFQHSVEFVDAAVEAVTLTHAALARITTRQGPDRLAQALRPVLEEILKDFAATGLSPKPAQDRLDDAARNTARFYFQAQQLNRIVPGQK